MNKQEDLTKRFVERFNYALTIKNLKAVDIVKRTGIDKSKISCYRKGLYLPKQDNLYLIAQALDVDIDWLLGLEDKEKATMKINVYSSVHCGILDEMIENVVDFEELSVEDYDISKQYFGLKIKGDSMQPKYVEGDTIIVEQTNVALSGYDYVVSYNDEEAFLKHIIIDDKQIILQALNPIYPPIIINKKDKYKIIGKVIELRRKI